MHLKTSYRVVCHPDSVTLPHEQLQLRQEERKYCICWNRWSSLTVTEVDARDPHVIR